MARSARVSGPADGKSASASTTPVENQAGPSRRPRQPSVASTIQSYDMQESSDDAGSPPAETQFRSQGEDSDDQLWEADCILDERGPVVTGQYLVQWVGNDPSTGQRWEPTWERRDGVTPQLAKEWKERKRVDPSIVGVEGRKLEAANKAKREAEKKRKREEKAVKSRKKAKGRNTPRNDSAATSRSPSAQIAEWVEKRANPRPRRSGQATVLRQSRETMDLTQDETSHPEDESLALPPQIEESDYMQQYTAGAEGRDNEPELDDSRPTLRHPAGTFSPVTSFPSKRIVPLAGDLSPPYSEDLAESEKEVQGKQEILDLLPADEPVVDKAKRVRIQSPLKPVRPGLTSAKGKARAARVSGKQVSGQEEETLCTKSKVATEFEKQVGDEEEQPQSTKTPSRKISGASLLSASPAKRANFFRDPTTDKPLASVPVPSASQFKALLPSTASDDSQSSASTARASQPDPIAEFSSPAPRASINEARARTAAMVFAQQHEVINSVGPAANIKVVKRVLDGEEVLAVESDSDNEAEADAEDSHGQQSPETTVESDDVVLADNMAVDEILGPVEASPSTSIKELVEAKSDLVAADLSNTIPDPKAQPMKHAMADEETLRYTSSRRATPNLAKVNSRAFEQLDAIALSKATTSARSSRPTVPDRNKTSAANITVKSSMPVEAAISPRSGESTDRGSLRLSNPLMKTAEEYEEQIAALHLLVAKIRSESGSVSSRDQNGSRATSSATPAVTLASEAPVQNNLPHLAVNTTPPATALAVATADSSTQTLVEPVVEVAAAASQTEPEVHPAPAAASTPAPAPVIEQDQLDALLVAKDAETKKWRIRAKRAEADLISTREDLQFFREQYQTASDSAVAEVAKTTELQERMTILQGQLKHGLKQREMHTAAMLAQHEKEVAKMVGQNKILLDQSRLTDDDVRAKAAKYPRVQLQLERAEILVKQAERKIANLTDRNDELLSQIEMLRAIQMGALADGGDNSEDEDYSNESDSGSDNRSPLPQNRTSTAAFKQEDSLDGSLTASQLMPDTQDLGPPSNDGSLEVTPALLQGTERRGQAYASPWTEGVFHADESVSPYVSSQRCDADEQAVKEHLMQEVDLGFFVGR